MLRLPRANVEEGGEVEGGGDPLPGEVAVGAGVEGGGAPQGDQPQQAQHPPQGLAHLGTGRRREGYQSDIV